MRLRDLEMALAVGRDMGGLGLANATHVLGLMASERDARYDEAARRWMIRFIGRAKPTPEELAEAGAALADALDDPHCGEDLMRLARLRRQ